MEYPAGMEDCWDSDDDEIVYNFNNDPIIDYDSGNEFKEDAPEFGIKFEEGEIPMRVELNVKKNRPVLYNFDDDYVPLDDLRIASKIGHIDCVKYFIERGVPVDHVLKGGWTALMYACNSGENVVVHYLLQNNADPNFHKDLFTPLMAVCASAVENEEKLFQCAIQLLEKGAKVNVKDKHKMSPLHFASRGNHYQIMQKLIEYGTDINEVDYKGWTALMWASFSGYENIVKLLLDNKANTVLVADNGETASDLARSRNNQLVLQLLGEDISTIKTEPQRIVKYEDLETFLSNLNFSDVIPLFNDRNLTFKDLLIMREKDLEDIGVKKVGVRKRILKGINTVHRVEWQTSSLPQLAKQNAITCFDFFTVLTNAQKHISYIEATVTYLRKTVQNYPKILKIQNNQTSRHHLINETECCLKNLQLLSTELKTFSKHLDKIKDNVEYHTSDLIEIIPHRCKSWQFASKILAIAIISTIGIWWKFPLFIKFFQNIKIKQ
ncbi:ankyrin repeat, SAM and basic leucine zipper domain-containing protein 1-like [Centruroides sculpturatus]|uniref:ankyrin repeat, SAM and basic leucine zipper domain-containing protein 1-like n=1 Tax=Centruroides sculpturatus TaxID=218467 RepID=UPI000C6D8C06|nr:ankyrin repeat, SAM and basic leucine zipper domain-containing protein 1-like [Centruroides sculpturatus]